MQAPAPHPTVRPRPADERRVLCSSCGHTEFVHGDLDARRCLYSECDCVSFTLGEVA